MLGEVALGLLARGAREGHVEGDDARRLGVAGGSTPAVAAGAVTASGSGSGAGCGAGAAATPQPLGLRLRGGKLVVEAPGAVAQPGHQLGDVLFQPLDARPQPVGGLGRVGQALLGLALGRGADLVRPALGRLDDRLDLRAGLGRERRAPRPRARSSAGDLVGDRLQVRIDRRRVVARGGGSGSRAARWTGDRGPRWRSA